MKTGTLIGGVLLLLPVIAPAQTALSGAESYTKYCASCHGDEGEGAVNWREMQAQGYSMPPPLNGEGNSKELTRDAMRKVIREGNFSDGGIMPPFASVLSDTEEDALLDYLAVMISGS